MMRRQSRLDFRTSFDIESNHLLIVGDDAGFAGGRTIGIDDHASTSTTMSPQLLTVFGRLHPIR